jgi:hypothetical protein
MMMLNSNEEQNAYSNNNTVAEIQNDSENNHIEKSVASDAKNNIDAKEVAAEYFKKSLDIPFLEYSNTNSRRPSISFDDEIVPQELRLNELVVVEENLKTLDQVEISVYTGAQNNIEHFIIAFSDTERKIETIFKKDLNEGTIAQYNADIKIEPLTNISQLTDFLEEMGIKNNTLVGASSAADIKQAMGIAGPRIVQKKFDLSNKDEIREKYPEITEYLEKGNNIVGLLKEYYGSPISFDYDLLKDVIENKRKDIVAKIQPTHGVENINGSIFGISSKTDTPVQIGNIGRMHISTKEMMNKIQSLDESSNIGNFKTLIESIEATHDAIGVIKESFSQSDANKKEEIITKFKQTFEQVREIQDFDIQKDLKMISPGGVEVSFEDYFSISYDDNENKMFSRADSLFRQLKKILVKAEYEKHFVYENYEGKTTANKFVKNHPSHQRRSFNTENSEQLKASYFMTIPSLTAEYNPERPIEDIKALDMKETFHTGALFDIFEDEKNRHRFHQQTKFAKKIEASRHLLRFLSPLYSDEIQLDRVESSAMINMDNNPFSDFMENSTYKVDGEVYSDSGLFYQYILAKEVMSLYADIISSGDISKGLEFKKNHPQIGNFFNSLNSFQKNITSTIKETISQISKRGFSYSKKINEEIATQTDKSEIVNFIDSEMAFVENSDNYEFNKNLITKKFRHSQGINKIKGYVTEDGKFYSNTAGLIGDNFNELDISTDKKALSTKKLGEFLLEREEVVSSIKEALDSESVFTIQEDAIENKKPKAIGSFLTELINDEKAQLSNDIFGIDVSTEPKKEITEVSEADFDTKYELSENEEIDAIIEAQDIEELEDTGYSYEIEDMEVISNDADANKTSSEDNLLEAMKNDIQEGITNKKDMETIIEELFDKGVYSESMLDSSFLIYDELINDSLVEEVNASENKEEKETEELESKINELKTDDLSQARVKYESMKEMFDEVVNSESSSLFEQGRWSSIGKTLDDLEVYYDKQSAGKVIKVGDEEIDFDEFINGLEYYMGNKKAFANGEVESMMNRLNEFYNLLGIERIKTRMNEEKVEEFYQMVFNLHLDDVKYYIKEENIKDFTEENSNVQPETLSTKECLSVLKENGFDLVNIFLENKGELYAIDWTAIDFTSDNVATYQGNLFEDAEMEVEKFQLVNRIPEVIKDAIRFIKSEYETDTFDPMPVFKEMIDEIIEHSEESVEDKKQDSELVREISVVNEEKQHLREKANQLQSYIDSIEGSENTLMYFREDTGLINIEYSDTVLDSVIINEKLGIQATIFSLLSNDEDLMYKIISNDRNYAYDLTNYAFFELEQEQSYIEEFKQVIKKQKDTIINNINENIRQIENEIGDERGYYKDENEAISSLKSYSTKQSPEKIIEAFSKQLSSLYYIDEHYKNVFNDDFTLGEWREKNKKVAKVFRAKVFTLEYLEQLEQTFLQLGVTFKQKASTLLDEVAKAIIYEKENTDEDRVKNINSKYGVFNQSFALKDLIKLGVFEDQDLVFYMATEATSYEEMKLYMELGIGMGETDQQFKESVLLSIYNKGNVEAIENYLEESEATEEVIDILSKKGPSGETLLHIACEEEDISIINLLVEKFNQDNRLSMIKNSINKKPFDMIDDDGIKEKVIEKNQIEREEESPILMQTSQDSGKSQ